MKAFLAGFSFLLALAFAGLAAQLLFGCLLPWRSAPETTHMTWVFAGVQFTGWQLLLPLLASTVAAAAMVIFGLWILRARR
jgi:hypothetical protein